MIDWSKPVQTRGGRPVRILCTDLKSHFPVVAVLDEKTLLTYTIDGFQYSKEDRSPNDLENVPPPKKKLFILVCQHPAWGGPVCQHFYEEANRAKHIASNTKSRVLWTGEIEYEDIP